ncbi:MAG: DMT family transporter [Minwuia sp.]|uniref:DMT family transporter n=1 Tax=Minwuia sp. TaxID=2493630 RepID=UPI003A8A715A
MTEGRENLRGAALMSLCMAGYGVNDAMMKLASEHVSFAQAILLRGLVATFLLAVIAWQRGAFRIWIAPGDGRTLLWRIVGEVGGTYCFLQALFNMPIANATAILQSLPLAVALAGSIFLGEKVGWRRYSAILVGFAGVMIIVRPGGEGFDAHSLWALGAVCFIVLRDLSTRRLSAGVPSVLVAVTTAFCITAMGAVMAPFQPWRPLAGPELALLGGAACFLIAGYLFSVSAMRIGDIGFVSPFRYTILIWAILSGIIVFGHYPDRWTLIGAGIVVATGIYTFYRERRLGQNLAARSHARPGPRP